MQHPQRPVNPVDGKDAIAFSLGTGDVHVIHGQMLELSDGKRSPHGP